MKRKAAMILALAMAFLLALSACGDKSPAGNSQTPGPSNSTNIDPQNTEAVIGTSDERLVIALSAEPNALIDCLAYNANVGAVTTSLFDTLVWYNSTTGEVEPMIAQSWDWEDERTVLFTLREDVVDFQGNPITSEDIMYSLQQAAASPAVAAWVAYYDVANCEAVGDYQVRIRTYEPYSQTVDALANKAFSIMSKDVTEAAGGLENCMTTAANGTGMYKLKTWNNGESMVLERNENYYGDPGYYKEIEFRFIPDAATRAMALRSGDVDFVQNLPASMVQEIQATDGIEALQLKAPVVLGVAINVYGQNTQYMSDPAVREALSYAINREAILGVAYLNYGEIADSMFPSFHYLYQAPAAEHAYTFDAEKAKSILRDAGYEDGEITINILVNANHYGTVAEILQNNLTAIGINVELNMLEVAAWIAESGKGEYDIIISNFYTSNPCDILKTIDGSISYSGRNYTGINDPVANDLVLAAFSETDPQAVKAAFDGVVNYMVYDNNLVIPTVSHYTRFGSIEGLTNIFLNTQGDHAYYGMIRPAA